MRTRFLLLLCAVLLLAVSAPDAGAQGPLRPSPSRSPVWSFPAFVPAVLAGDADAAGLLGAAIAIDPALLPLVELNQDPIDGALDGSVAARLTDEQEALLGCGAWWGTDCARDGIDLRNADAGVLVQSWVGGTLPPRGLPARPPGARGPFLSDGVTPNPDYDPNVDGTTTGLFVPPGFGGRGISFRSEMAALSFNLQMLLVAFGTGAGGRDELDPRNPYAYYDPNDRSTRSDRAQCSFLQPQYCASVQAFFDVVQPPARTGGNGSFGRRDFVWHGGSSKAEKRCATARRDLATLSRSFAGEIGSSRTGRAGRCPRR